MPELPKLSQAIRGLTTIEDTFESTVSQATGVSPPQGLMKTLVNVMEQIEGSSPGAIIPALPERVELPNLQLSQLPTPVASGISVSPNIDEIRNEMEEISAKIVDVETSLKRIEKALKEIPSISEEIKENKEEEKIEEKSNSEGGRSRDVIDF